MNSKNKILVLGLGNDILKDDGIGPKLSAHISKEKVFEGVDFNTAAAGGMELLEMVRDYETVFIIDAIKTQNGVPGTVYELGLSDFKTTLHIPNFHDIDFLTSLEFAKKIGISIPDKIHIIAVEIVEDMEFGSEFTPKLQERYEEVFSETVDIIREKLKYL